MEFFEFVMAITKMREKWDKNVYSHYFQSEIARVGDCCRVAL